MCEDNFFSSSSSFSANLKFAVRTNNRIPGAYYQIFERGNVLVSQYVDAKNSYSFEFTVKPTLEMLSGARVLVYYITASGDIISAYENIQFNEAFKNNVSWNTLSGE